MSNTINQQAASFWASIVAKAWEDEKFKALLLKDPDAALQEMGFESLRRDDCSGQKIQVVVKEDPNFKSATLENDVLTIYLPVSPEGFSNLMFTGIFGPGACT